MTEYAAEHDDRENRGDPANDIADENEGPSRTRRRRAAQATDGSNSKFVIMKEMSFQKIRERMEVLQSKFLEEMDEKMSEVVSELLKEVETSELVNDSQRYLFEDSQKYENRIKSEKAGVLPDKQFLARNSLLTDLFEIKHIRTIYHIFIAILIILFLNTVIYDLVDTGRLNLSFELIIWSFGDMRTVIMIWLCMMASTFGVYLCFHLYATHRARLQPNDQKKWDRSWLALLVIYQLVFLWLPTWSVLHHDLPPASSLIVLMEQVRLLMKSHAFVRSNVPRARKFKQKREDSGDPESPCPGFSCFLYFLFVPTLVYRDTYPRIGGIQPPSVPITAPGTLWFMIGCTLTSTRTSARFSCRRTEWSQS